MAQTTNNFRRETSAAKPRRRRAGSQPEAALWLPQQTELVGLEFELEVLQDSDLSPQYPTGLHAWFLDQVRQHDPMLSTTLHDGQDEKAFTISGLEGDLRPKGQGFELKRGDRYCWRVTALSQPVAQWLGSWLQALPSQLALRSAPLQICQVRLWLPPTTYAQIWQQTQTQSGTVTLSFVSPTSFRRRGHHFPLPVPYNLFHSYLRRWNQFADMPIDQEAYLTWVDEMVLVLRHRLESVKVLAGKRGAVTGFTGAVDLGLAAKAKSDSQFTRLFYALAQLAAYCGTGHKTTFGLGQTRLGWLEPSTRQPPAVQALLASRIAELTARFKAQRQRQGGDRATAIAETWATILARRELGESLQAIAADLEMPYETVKTYAKLARRALTIAFAK